MKSTTQLTRATVATSIGFLLLGVFGGSFVAMIPRLQVQFQLSPSVLGGLLLISPIGSLLVMIGMPLLLQRVSHHALTRTALFILPIALAVLAAAQSVWLVGVSIYMIGVSNALVGISLNTYGVDVEHTRGRHMLSRLHAANSMGTLIGAAVAGGLLLVTGSRPESLMLIAAGMLIIALVILPRFVRLGGKQSSPAPLLSLVDTGWPLLFPLVAIGMLLISLAEGATSDWSGVFMTQYHHAGPLLAAGAYIGFTASMTIVRVFGGTIIGRIGRWRSFLWSVIIAVIGLSIALLVPFPIATIIGFMLLGWGVALLVPMLISGAGIAGGNRRDQFIAQVSIFGVIGQMTGPALIGLIASFLTLRAALFVPALALFSSAVIIFVIKQNRYRITYC